MSAENVRIANQIGPAPLAISATPTEIPWNVVVVGRIKLFGGILPKATPANAETDNLAGDVITVTLITLKDMNANVETENQIGDA